MPLAWKRFWTIFLILIAEGGYALTGLGVLANIADFHISYAWIWTRLILVGVGMVSAPIIISHAIQWIDKCIIAESRLEHDDE